MIITELPVYIFCKIDGNMDSSPGPAVHVEDLSGSDSGKDSGSLLCTCTMYLFLFVSLRKNIVHLSVRHLEKEVSLNS